MQLFHDEEEILAVIRGIKKLLIFLALKPFLIQTDCESIPSFVKMNLSNMQVQGRLLHWQFWFNQFSFSIEHILGSKNSLVDSLTRKLAMLIIKTELLLEKKKIQNEMSVLLEQVSPSSRILIDILKFHIKSRSRFGLLSLAYLIA